ncbi:MAG: molecular chaperone [Hyphomicrobiaceae bacterium]
MAGQQETEGGRDGMAGARRLAAALQQDAELLAILHDREVSPGILAALKAAPFADQMAVRLRSNEALAALSAFDAAIGQIPQEADAGVFDALAVDYSDVYLRHACRIQPSESFWLTEDHLERQGPMLELREEMRRANLRLTDWAGRAEDHLVPQLLFIARLLDTAGKDGNLEGVAHVLDRHLLQWVGRFAQGLAAARGPELYVAIAALTAAWCGEVRDVLAQVTGIPRPAVTDEKKNASGRKRSSTRSADPPQETPYMPGIGPGW